MKKKKAKKRSRSFLLGFALAVFMVYLGISTVNTRLKINDYDRKIETAQKQLAVQEAENENVQELIETADEDELIERIARERLGYVMPDEKVYYDAG